MGKVASKLDLLKVHIEECPASVVGLRQGAVFMVLLRYA